MKHLILLLSIATILFSSTSFTNKPKKNKEGEGIKWVSLKEAIELSKKEPRKIFIDVYTDWCGWCKRMDQATFQNEKVGEYMNEKFYCVKLNAETYNEEIVLGNTTFKKTGRNHELAIALLQGKMSYPTVVFLDESFSTIQPVPGYRAPGDFLNMAKFFGDNSYKTMSWEQYNQR